MASRPPPEEHARDRVGREILLRGLHVEGERRRDVERKELRHEEADDDGEAERAARIRAGADPERDGQRPQQRGQASIATSIIMIAFFFTMPTSMIMPTKP
jgi:hypothetical protein